MGRATSFLSGSGLGAEHFIAALIGSSDDAIVGLTPQGTVVSWNDAAEPLFDYRSEEMLGRTFVTWCTQSEQGFQTTRDARVLSRPDLKWSLRVCRDRRGPSETTTGRKGTAMSKWATVDNSPSACCSLC